MTSIDNALGSLLAAQESSVHSQIAFSVAAKKLDAFKNQGEAVAQLLEAAAQLSRAVGKGARFDAQA